MASAPTGTSFERDYETLRSGCGLFDRSARGKLALGGPDAIEFLNGQVTQELADLTPGHGRYAAFLTHKGKMLGDLRVLAFAGEDGGVELLLDTERVALQNLFDMIRRFKVGYRVELHKRTLERGLLSLIGPRTASVCPVSGLGPDEHDNAAVQVDGVPALAVRTDVGLDLICAADDSERLASGLRERGAAPVDEQAVECLRIERGIPRYGVELDDSVIPQEAALNERAVSLTKGCYVGQETVARLFYKGRPNRLLRGLLLSQPVPPGTPLLLGERIVGHVGASVVSPRLGPIALAIVRREAEPGSHLTAGDASLDVTVLELPFERRRDADDPGD